MAFQLRVEKKVDGTVKVDIKKGDDPAYAFDGAAKDLKTDYKPKNDLDDNTIVALYDRFLATHGVSIIDVKGGSR